jgi:hypothetical protein
MNIREEINKILENLPDEDLEGVLEYIRFIQEPEEVAVIARGKEEIARGEVVSCRDIKKELEKKAL